MLRANAGEHWTVNCNIARQLTAEAIGTTILLAAVVVQELWEAAPSDGKRS